MKTAICLDAYFQISSKLYNFRNFLRDATDDLLSARKRCETEEHIQDAKMERNKLLDRFTIIEKILQEHEEIKVRF